MNRLKDSKEVGGTEHVFEILGEGEEGEEGGEGELLYEVGMEAPDPGSCGCDPLSIHRHRLCAPRSRIAPR